MTKLLPQILTTSISLLCPCQMLIGCCLNRSHLILKFIDLPIHTCDHRTALLPIQILCSQKDHNRNMSNVTVRNPVRNAIRHCLSSLNSDWLLVDFLTNMSQSCCRIYNVLENMLTSVSLFIVSHTFAYVIEICFG